MGMESFFIKVLSPNLKIEERIDNELSEKMQTTVRFNYVIGKDNRFDVKWYKKLRSDNLQNLKMTNDFNKFIVNDCVEFNIRRNNENSIYIDLIGSFSCFDISIKTMRTVLENIKNIAEIDTYYYVWDKIYKFDSDTFYDNIIASYGKKYEEFKKTFPKANFITRPSNFYKEYSGIIPRFKRKIKNIFSLRRRCF